LAKSFESDTILANSGWQAITMFNSLNKDGQSNLNYLKMSMKYCGEIGNAIIKQGVLTMIWSDYLSKRISNLTNLIEKVSKQIFELKKKNFNYKNHIENLN
jgi:hypothetical protein